MKVLINTNIGGNFRFSVQATLELLAKDPTSPYLSKRTFEDWGVVDHVSIERLRHIVGAWYDDGHGYLYNLDTETIWCIDCVDCEQAEDVEDYNHRMMVFRTDPTLVDLVERMADSASGPYSNIVVLNVLNENITIDDVLLNEYDGKEWLAEKHRTWGWEE